MKLTLFQNKVQEILHAPGKKILSIEDTLHALAASFKVLAEGNSFPEPKIFTGMALSYYAIHLKVTEDLAKILKSLKQPDIYPNLSGSEEQELCTIHNRQLSLAHGEALHLSQKARDASKRWLFLVEGGTLNIKAADQERWEISPWNKCRAVGSPNLRAKEGYVVPNAPEGCLVVGLNDGDSEELHAIASANTDIVLSGLLKAVFLIANDDLPKLYGAGFDDNQGHVSVEAKLIGQA